jgi:hypothetical protein
MTTIWTGRKSLGRRARCALVAVAVGLAALALAETSHAGCDPTPRWSGCKRSADKRDVIDIQGPSAFDTFSPTDRVTWRIPKLEATSAADLPDPQTTDYAVCFYLLDSHEELVLGHEAIAAAGVGCGRPRCWTRNASGGVGYAGGPLRPDGIVSLRVRPGAHGKAQLGFVGRGTNLAFPGPQWIFGGELIMQVQAGASCWSAYYLNPGQPPAIRTNTRYRMKGSWVF